jgi:hypothetical protein
MPRMIELIRSSAVPANLVQAAARGALAVPQSEMIEILVYLATHNRLFAQQARMTLAGWDEKASIAAAADPATRKEVLDYFIATENLRPALLPALLENPSVDDDALMTLAAAGSREIVEAMSRSARVRRSPAILSTLASNANVSSSEGASIHEQLAATGFEEAAHADATPAPEGEGSDEADRILDTFLTEHANELAREAEKPFQPIGELELESSGVQQQVAGGTATEIPPATAVEPASQAEDPVVAASTAAATTASAGSATGHAAHAAAPAMKKVVKKEHLTPEEERGSALQKIARLDIKGRIQLAMKGTKEERSILVRDGTKLVALAVLESPKITDGEVEKFAAQKNVLEAVLRQVTMKRRFMKNYAVVRNLVFNPRTPLDVSLALMKNILVNDLRNLSSNKEVSDTIRKLALKMFKQKKDPSKKSMD